MCIRDSHKGATCKYKVWTCRIQAFVNEEVFLFPTQVAMYLLYVRIKIMTNLCGGDVHSMQSTKQWSLVVESLASIRNEDCRYTESVVDDEYWRCRIPS